MIFPLKIECGCGQRYAFDVETSSGQMPFAVACPACNADGTAAANQGISQVIAAQAAVLQPESSADSARSEPSRQMRLQGGTPEAAAPNPAPAVHSPEGAPAPRRLLPGQCSPEQAMVEARAKIFWGDPKEDAVRFLMMQGFTPAEAEEAAEGMFEERVKTLRSIGRRKLIMGFGLMLVPVISLGIFLSIGYVDLKLFAVTAMVGVYGIWVALRGTVLIVSPRSEKCDISGE